MSYQDNMTLDEIAANDLEMAKDAIKNAKKFTFYNPRAAIRFTGECVKATLIRMGLPNFEKIPQKLLKKIQKEKKIKVEHRARYQGENFWRNGIYIYKDDILVAFISEVLVPNQKPRLISLPGRPTLGQQEYHVITNARTE